MQKKGFTLIELLVVIAIIAILAAILYPVILESKRKSLEVKCTTNLRQIGVATGLYMGDNDGYYPPYIANASDYPWGTWFIVAQKYAKTKLLAKCPADFSGTNAIGGYWSNVYTHYWTGYLFWTLPVNVQPANDTDITHTRSTVYLQDGPFGGANCAWWGPPYSFIGHVSEPDTRHSGGANVLFCDWHVKLVRPGQFKSNFKNTGAGDPLRRKVPSGAIGPSQYPPPPWNNRNDGNNPWYRGD